MERPPQAATFGTGAHCYKYDYDGWNDTLCPSKTSIPFRYKDCRMVVRGPRGIIRATCAIHSTHVSCGPQTFRQKKVRRGRDIHPHNRERRFIGEIEEGYHDSFLTSRITILPRLFFVESYPARAFVQSWGSEFQLETVGRHHRRLEVPQQCYRYHHHHRGLHHLGILEEETQT